jgi:NAD-dependent dihydropyrimidine dehydrogenase PreA subunit
MAHVITGKCLGEARPACLEECPVDCIHPRRHQGKPLMVIDPEACVDCGTCLPACPVGAIVGSTEDEPAWTALNAELA